MEYGTLLYDTETVGQEHRWRTKVTESGCSPKHNAYMMKENDAPDEAICKDSVDWSSGV